MTWFEVEPGEVDADGNAIIGWTEDGQPVIGIDPEGNPIIGRLEPMAGTGGTNGSPIGTGGDGSGADGTGGDGTGGDGTGGNGTGGSFPDEWDGVAPVPMGCEWINTPEKQGFRHYENACVPTCSVAEDPTNPSNPWGSESGSQCVYANPAEMDSNFHPCTFPGFDVADLKEDECPPEGSYDCPAGFSCGCMIVPGLGANKRALLEAGAYRIPYMLASAMLETDTMSVDYTKGDGKSGFAFNSGVCKQNWMMMRECHAEWRGLPEYPDDVSWEPMKDPALDVQVYQECRDHYGDDWWAGHRGGQTGLENPTSYQIPEFKESMDWTYCMLTNHFLDDVRFWVTVPPV